MKNILLLVLLISTTVGAQNTIDNKVIHNRLESWHKAAAEADFETYFSIMTPDGVFIGTDASENWTVPEFKAYAQPYFDKGKAWSFSAIERNIYNAGGVVYFDELLDTQMGLCRGSGIMIYQNGQWCIAHYVLSIAVPNNVVDDLIKLKGDLDQRYIRSQTSNKRK